MDNACLEVVCERETGSGAPGVCGCAGAAPEQRSAGETAAQAAHEDQAEG